MSAITSKKYRISISLFYFSVSRSSYGRRTTTSQSTAKNHVNNRNWRQDKIGCKAVYSNSQSFGFLLSIYYLLLKRYPTILCAIPKMILTFLYCLLIVSTVAAHSYPQEEIERAQDRRNAWWKEQDRKYLEAKKKEAIQSIEQSSPPKHLHATNPQDKLALERFYTSTNGPQWAVNSGWMKGDPCMNSWRGVYCSDTGRVKQLSLTYNLISGPLPVDILRLDQLKILILNGNGITAVPEGLFSHDSLEILDLGNNEIHTPLPDAINMANITGINLYTNKIPGSIPTRWNTPNLESLSLSSNKIEGELPHSLSKISSFQQLYVSNNLLTGRLPSSYSKLTGLTDLSTFSNNFNNARLPPSWSSLRKLVSVEMDGLSGKIPDYVGTHWSELKKLVLVGGKLKGGFPRSLCNLKMAQHLHLYNNSLTGELPDCICQLSSIATLDISGNRFTGPIPQCIGELSNVITLVLSRNRFTGELPPSIGNLWHLRTLDVSRNGIYGSIPSTLNRLAGHLVQLGLCYNKLSSVENGLEELFDYVKDYSCLLYNNPWNCPLPSFVPKECEATCSPCNSGQRHTSCSTCIASDGCGWCNEGGNCLPGSSRRGPDDEYMCKPFYWSFGPNARCPANN